MSRVTPASRTAPRSAFAGYAPWPPPTPPPPVERQPRTIRARDNRRVDFAPALGTRQLVAVTAVLSLVGCAGSDSSNHVEDQRQVPITYIAYAIGPSATVGLWYGSIQFHWTPQIPPELQEGVEFDVPEGVDVRVDVIENPSPQPGAGVVGCEIRASDGTLLDADRDENTRRLLQADCRATAR